jgi:hypothetical protein
MASEKINKCCQEFEVMVEKIKTTAKVVEGKIYLDQQNRKHLTDWVEANEEEISNCPRCGVVVKKWIEGHFLVSEENLENK